MNKYWLTAGLVLIVSMALIVWWFFSSKQKESSIPVLNEVIEVVGVVENPTTGTPVSDVTLSVGDTEVTTGVSGQFRFKDVDPAEGILLSHASITASIRLIPSTENSTVIYFDPDLFAAIGTYFILERELQLQFFDRKHRYEVIRNEEMQIHTNVFISRIYIDSEWQSIVLTEDASGVWTVSLDPA